MRRTTTPYIFPCDDEDTIGSVVEQLQNLSDVVRLSLTCKTLRKNAAVINSIASLSSDAARWMFKLLCELYLPDGDVLSDDFGSLSVGSDSHFVVTRGFVVGGVHNRWSVNNGSGSYVRPDIYKISYKKEDVGASYHVTIRTDREISKEDVNHLCPWMFKFKDDVSPILTVNGCSNLAFKPRCDYELDTVQLAIDGRVHNVCMCREFSLEIPTFAGMLAVEGTIRLHPFWTTRRLPFLGDVVENDESLSVEAHIQWKRVELRFKK